ncbi:MAG: RHS repeat protein [Bacteroidales bacterium]|jgi:YD repeat-containing protein|nr:RHS repeat protein [Bacteroidales bacterium]
MKKIVSFIPIIALVLFFFSGCDKYDEIYSPKCMISKVWYRSNVDTNVNFPEGIYTAPASETYNYNGEDQITSISLISGRGYAFTYDDDGRITTITYVNKYGLTENITYTYEGEKKKKFMVGLEYMIDGTVRQTVSFTRRADKTVASIDIQYDREFFKSLDEISKSEFYEQFVGYNDNAITAMQQSDSKELTRKSFTQVFYDEKTMNIIKSVTTIPESNYVETTLFEYDDKMNPFFEMPFSYCANYNGDNIVNTRSSNYNFLIGFSENNKTMENTDIKFFGNSHDYTSIHYIYEYNEKDYPRRITERSSKYNNIPNSIFILYVNE